MYPTSPSYAAATISENMTVITSSYLHQVSSIFVPYRSQNPLPMQFWSITAPPPFCRNHLFCSIIEIPRILLRTHRIFLLLPVPPPVLFTPNRQPVRRANLQQPWIVGIPLICQFMKVDQPFDIIVNYCNLKFAWEIGTGRRVTMYETAWVN